MDNYNGVVHEDFGLNSRIIGVNGDSFLVTNSNKATLNDAFDYGILMDENGRYLTQVFPIGSLIKGGYWTGVDEPFSSRIHKKAFSVKDAVLGFIVGDAFGLPFEFISREDIKKVDLNDMINAKNYSVSAGSWSGDSSMIISSLSAIVQGNGIIDFKNVMDCFVNWLYHFEYTSDGKIFGVNKTIQQSIINYVNGMSPLDCGNNGTMSNDASALMRILPFSLYCILLNLDEDKTYEVICWASQLTNNSDVSKMGCFIYTEFLKEAIRTLNPVLALKKMQSINYNLRFSPEVVQEYNQVLRNRFLYLESSKIKESGYVVDILEAALFSAIHGKNYKDTIITAIKLGSDTNTVAGIAGSIAGVIYGFDDIPSSWISVLKKKDYLEDLSLQFEKILKKR